MEQISVIVPIYNVDKYLDECIQSIINQTYKNLQIILVDDGSTDTSSSICDRYAQADTRIKVIHKKNEGLVKARKDGLKVAVGRYILCVDGDDWIESHMIERLYDIMLKESVDIVMCGRYEDMESSCREVYHGFKAGRYDKTALLETIYPGMIVKGGFFEWGIFPNIWDKLYRRECLEPFQMEVDDRITMGEDAACTYLSLLNANSIYILHECLYHYRQIRTSMVKSITDAETARLRFRVLYQTVLQRLNDCKYIYDLRSQWNEYLLFLMVPRFQHLYRGVETLEFLFPFPKVKKNSNIIIYGMGTYGQLLYKYLLDTNFCRVVAMADRNYKELQKQGLPVVSPEEISEYQYDAIVVANSFAKTRMAIYEELSKHFPKEKIHLMDEEMVKSEKVMSAFGLIE